MVVRVLPLVLVVAILSSLAGALPAGAARSEASCDGASPRPPVPPTIDVPRTEPAGPIARFADVTARAGLKLDGSPICVAPHCFLSPRMLARKFPKLKIGRDDGVTSGLCQMERFSGGAAVGDFDADGSPDVYVTRLHGPGRLFRNRGDGTFVDVTKRARLDTLREPSAGAAFVDIDNDGDDDLVVATLAAKRTYLYVNNGSGRFSEQGRKRGVAGDTGRVHLEYSVAAGDYDRDGYADLYVTEYRGPSKPTGFGAVQDPRLLRNRGREKPGYFEDVTEQAGVGPKREKQPIFDFGATFRDIDDDGWPDLAVTGDFGTSKLFWNQHDGTFVNGTKAAGVGTEENGMGAATGHLDGDGVLDRFVSSVYDERGDSILKGGNWGGTGNRLWRQDAPRSFTDITGSAGVRDGHWGWGAVFIDPLNRGALDIAQASGMDYPVGPIARPFRVGPTRYWRNDGEGRFSEMAGAVGLDATNGRGLLAFDYDSDGRVDLLMLRPGAQPVLYRNESTTEGAWLRVVAKGSGSNRDGFNAVVSVRARPDGPLLRQEIQSVSDFSGQSERVAHFGLGAGISSVAEVSVEFPATGEQVVRRDVRTNQALLIEEPRD